MLIPILANDALGPFPPPISGGIIWPSPMVRSSFRRGTAACFFILLQLALLRFFLGK